MEGRKVQAGRQNKVNKSKRIGFQKLQAKTASSLGFSMSHWKTPVERRTVKAVRAVKAVKAMKAAKAPVATRLQTVKSALRYPRREEVQAIPVAIFYPIHGGAGTVERYRTGKRSTDNHTVFPPPTRFQSVHGRKTEKHGRAQCMQLSGEGYCEVT